MIKFTKTEKRWLEVIYYLLANYIYSINENKEDIMTFLEGYRWTNMFDCDKLKKETEKKYEVALVFLLFQFLYLNCEIMRETIAISMFYFAFSFYIKRRWLPYYGICAVCFFFHDAAIFYFFLPLLYPILTREFTAKYVIVMATFILVFANPLGKFFSTKFSIFINSSLYASSSNDSILSIKNSSKNLLTS